MTKDEQADAFATDALDLAESIKPLLAGHEPPVQGGALAELLACFLWGHRVLDGADKIDRDKTAALRRALLDKHLALTWRLVESNDFGEGAA